MEQRADDVKKLRVLLPHWIEHNGEHASGFRDWAGRAGPAGDALLAAAELLDQANGPLAEALELLGGPLKLAHGEHKHHGAHHHHDGRWITRGEGR